MKSPTTVSSASKWTTCVGLMVGALLCAGLALAESPRGAAFVDSVDPTKRTIVLRGERYGVATTAELEGVKGQPIRLADLRPVPEGLVDKSTNEADIVAWEAVRGPNGWMITSLRVLDDMPN